MSDLDRNDERKKKRKPFLTKSHHFGEIVGEICREREMGRLKQITSLLFFPFLTKLFNANE